MGRPSFGLALGFGLFLLLPASPAHAQLPTDPFQAYFGFYLPHQAAIAQQSTPLDTINAAQAAQQFAAAADRTGLYDPSNPFGDENADPLRPYARSGRERLIRPHIYPTSTANARQRGSAPPVYYNRAARYYPTLRASTGPNHNLAVHRIGRGGGMSMPSMPSMPGPR
ncbi:hypothetical protein [Singulisphaera acidiphila]|uniref:Uncharacterized protein n=1 Tax=Singulisphaera acidiphila (strain ATCC BAA-1392 / DSM 18658 / VKM B-2454 / MOB10) TaxID=886293 RepID=L0DHG9_SINAD|nr:hypothetical protein [Singulisphaera acidiphila]AGA28121.1 hypothetical protein Sinac_3893 [Singulisphaera acidiphila DSM 18658]